MSVEFPSGGESSDKKEAEIFGEVEAPKEPETAEDLKSQVDAQKQQLRKELEDIIKRSQEFSAKQQGSEVDPTLVVGA